MIEQLGFDAWAQPRTGWSLHCVNSGAILTPRVLLTTGRLIAGISFIRAMRRREHGG